ncbi:MAG: 4-(cytidine 5'-diphospho)-2-C-methyl-D-erythritol kinase [Chitinophagaceae bacterium]
MISFPNAKINLGLHILHKRADGFHELETIFYPVRNLRDVLEFIPLKQGESRMVQTGLAVLGDYSENLAWRAFQKIKNLFPTVIPELEIHLHKAIPMGAGLGGGSADASFILTMLNEYFSLGLSIEELELMSLELGSDCPFFIRNSPQYATGRGEIMTPIELDLSAYRLEVFCPKVYVSTRAAFSKSQPKAATFNLKTLPQIPVAAWREVLKNDFEESVFAQYPEVKAAKDKLYADGAVYASMSGSGSAVFGLFQNK